MSRNEQAVCPRCQSDDIFFSRGEACICGSCGLRFQLPQLPKEEQPFQPMKLFLSYGHKEAVICRLINQALKDRGHTTWFDEDKLHQGQDWRQKITDGLTDCNGVISCLSRHSVRDPGVCLNELSIAIGVRGGNIKTILLEPEKEVRPPVSLCHIQWLDMSDWRSWYGRGEAVFQPWFDAKMEQLFQVIESDESREFTGQISAIQEKLHINYSTNKQRDLLQRLFVGREWLTRQLEQWLDDPEGPRLCALYGDPGVGKSAFAANYIHYNPRVAAGLFCEYDRPVYNDARTVIMTLAYLLACRLPGYRAALVAVLEREKRLGMMNASELFDLLLADPLTAFVIDGGHETLCVVIDGLDECGQGEYNALAEVLARYVPRLPAWLRVLVTSREVAAVKAPLAGAFALELHGDDLQNQVDVRRYFVERLEESQGGDPAWERALDALTQRSGGIFLYAQLVCEGILAGKLSLHDADRFPEGLSKAFHQWFGWFFPDIEEFKADFRLPLGMLLAAPGPLPTEELKRIFGWDNNRLGDFLLRVEILLRQDVDDFGKQTVTFSHLYLSEWLDTEQAKPFRSDRTAALERMAERFYALFQKDVNSLTEYESLHLAALLEQCGNTAALAEVILNRTLLWNIISAGDHCRTWGKLPAASACFEQARAMAERMVQKRNTLEDRRDLSVGCCRVAELLEAKGSLDEALELYRKGMEIAEQLVRERGTPEDRRDLSVGCCRVAGLLEAKGSLDEALELYQKCMKIAEQLVQERGTLSEHSDLSDSYRRIAGILQAKGDLDRALELYRKSVVINEWLARTRGAPDDHRNLSYIHQMIAGILQLKGDSNRALELYWKSVDLAELLVQERGTPDDRLVLSQTYYMTSNLLQIMGDSNRALELGRKNIDIAEQLVRERGIPNDLMILSNACFLASNQLQSSGDLDKALELGRRGIAILERLVRERGVPNDLFILGNSCDTVAGILQAKGDLDGALELGRRSIAILERLVREYGTPNYCGILSSSYDTVACILQAKGDLDGALEVGRKGIDIAGQLAREYGAPDYCLILSNSCDTVAGILQAKGDLDGALELGRKSIAVAEQLAREHGAPNYCLILSNFYDTVAGILQAKGDLDGALELGRKGIAVAERLVRERGTPDDRRCLSINYVKVAGILEEQGDLDGALELYWKDLEIAEQLVRELGTVSEFNDLAVSCYNLAALPALSAADRLTWARRGLELSEQLLRMTGLDSYREFCEDFQELIDELEQPGG